MSAAEYTTTLGDGTRVTCWLDAADIWRARIEHEGTDFVRLDTCEQRLERIPKRHVRIRAATTSDLIVLKHCAKSAQLLGCFEELYGQEPQRIEPTSAKR